VVDELWFVLVPQGHPKIAHRFNGGKQCMEEPKAPEGRQKAAWPTARFQNARSFEMVPHFLSSLTGLILFFDHLTHQ